MNHTILRRSVPAVSLLAGLHLAVVPLCAQTSPAESSHQTMPPVVVYGDSPVSYQTKSSSSALFSDVPLIETPFSVSVYNKELMEDRRAFQLDDLLENDPSIARQMPSGFYGTQNLGLRGFRVDNFFGYRVDGLPMSHTVSPYLDDKETVEVLKGPPALRFGFMPPGGAVNLVRKRPTPEAATSLQFDINTFGSLYSQIDTSNTVADGTFGYRLVLAGDEFDSFYDNAGGERYMGSLFTEWKPVDSVSIWASASGQNFKRNGYYGPLISANGKVFDTGIRTNTMQDWSRNEHESFDLALGTDIDLNEDWKLRTAFNYQDARRSSAVGYASAVQDNGDFEDYGFLLGDKLQQWETKGVHAHLEGRFDTGAIEHNTVLGAEYREMDTEFGDRLSPFLGNNNVYHLIKFPRPADPTVSWDAYHYKETGVFLTDTVKFTDKFSALLGVRYGRIEATEYWKGALDYEYDADTWAPTFALMYEPAENVHTYVTYTRGMQDAGLTPFRGVANPYEPLGVQHSEQWEAGVKFDLIEGRLSGELAVFQIEQDLAVTDPVTNIHALNGQQRHRGLEVALRGRVTEELEAGVSAMLLDAEQVDTGSAGLDGMRPQYVPEYQVNFWAVLDIPQVPGLALTANARFVDKQYLDEAELFATDNYFLLDLGARYKFEVAKTDWTLRLNVQNVLDERYFESGEYYAGDAGYLSYGAPVSANFSLQIDF